MNNSVPDVSNTLIENVGSEAQMEDLKPADSQEFNRLVIQLFSVLEFSKDEASDPFAIVRLFEQSLVANSCLNHEALSVDMLAVMLEHLLKHMADNQGDLQHLGHNNIVL